MYNTSKRDLSGLSDLNVRADFNSSVAAMKTIGAELQKLPQDPNAKPSSQEAALNARLDKVGGRAGTDYSMFLLGGLEAGLTSTIAGAAGMHLSHAASQGMDMATSMISEYAESQKATLESSPSSNAKDGKVKKDKQESVFRPKFRRDAEQNNGPKKPGATMIMQASMKRKAALAFKHAEPKRKVLEKQLTEAESLAQVMAFYQNDTNRVEGIYSSVEARGEKVQTKRDGQIRLANTGVYRKYEQQLGQKPRFAAPAPRMGMGMAC